MVQDHLRGVVIVDEDGGRAESSSWATRGLAPPRQGREVNARQHGMSPQASRGAPSGGDILISGVNF
ncbi:hypothetical protein HPP92_007427 [Vanilla planifolia]|uniref:Uncharacterized protein n=1 Tax=Vanilla planifolia TaxID=51239 RepID=A0A835RA58_VANPL|nr:hypothetical protein HPP92_007427 [Vanilla planifolia]